MMKQGQNSQTTVRAREFVCKMLHFLMRACAEDDEDWMSEKDQIERLKARLRKRDSRIKVRRTPIVAVGCEWNLKLVCNQDLKVELALSKRTETKLREVG